MTASASLSVVTSRRPDDSSALKRSQASMYRRYSAQLTSQRPIHRGSTVTSKTGPSSAARPASSDGDPIRNVPPGTGIMRKVTSVPGMVSSYATIQPPSTRTAWSPAGRASPVTMPGRSVSTATA